MANITGTVVKHAVLRAWSVVCVFAVIGFFVWAGYKVFNPDPTTTQKAETIVNNTYNPEKRSLIDWKIWIFRVKVW